MPAAAGSIANPMNLLERKEDKRNDLWKAIAGLISNTFAVHVAQEPLGPSDN